MHWVVQDNLYQERGYDVLIKTIEQFDLPRTYVKVIPFSHELQPDVQVPGPKIVIGSLTLGKVAERRKWKPGVFTNENFTYEKWRDGYGKWLLSPDLTVCRFEDVAPELDHFFMRPCADDKAFSGQVFASKDFQEWKSRVLDLRNEYATLTPTTMVAYGRPKEIYRECRFFVVDEKVVTGSTYKIGTRVHPTEEVPAFMLDFATWIVRQWQPHRAFAIDIADTPKGPRVIEIGSLNSCGFYAADVQKLILTLEETFS